MKQEFVHEQRVKISQHIIAHQLRKNPIRAPRPVTVAKPNASSQKSS